MSLVIKKCVNLRHKLLTIESLMNGYALQEYLFDYYTSSLNSKIILNFDSYIKSKSVNKEY